MSELVLVSIEDRIATITFHRPEVLNALNPEMAAALREAIECVEHEKQARCVVIRGAGANFMAGGDVMFFKQSLQMFKEHSQETLSRVFDDVHTMVRGIRRMQKPVVASVQGVAAGFGFSLMIACDLVIAAEDSKFRLAYCQLGTSPDGGCTYLLPRTIGSKRAMELALLGETIDAKRAEILGLVNKVVPAEMLDEHTHELAARLASGPALAYANTKALINVSSSSSFEAQLEREQARFAECAASPDFAEAVIAFCEKRPPKFDAK